MTDAEFLVAIDYNGLTKQNLLTIAAALADRIDSRPSALEPAVTAGTLTPKQANFLEAVRAVKGDNWAEAAAVTVNIGSDVLALADQVKAWITTHPGATDAQIKAAFPPITAAQWVEITRYLVNTKQIRTGYTV